MHLLPVARILLSNGQDCKCEYLLFGQALRMAYFYMTQMTFYNHSTLLSFPSQNIIAHFSDENDTNLGDERGGLLCQLCPLRSSDPLLRRSLDGARVASVSPVIVSTDSERLGISMCANGAKLSSTICRALW